MTGVQSPNLHCLLTAPSVLYFVSRFVSVIEAVAMWLWPLWCAFLWHVAGHQGIPQDELGGIGGDGWVELPKVVDPTCSCQPSSSASDGELLQLSQWNCLRIHQAGVDYATLAANYGQNVNQDPGCPNLLKVNDCYTGMESGDFYVLISTHP